MSHRDGLDGIAGLSTEDAVDAVLDADDSFDRTTVRGALGTVTDDGVVTRVAVEEAMTETTTAVSTPETRAELAAIALEEAREAAAPVEDLDAVYSRLSAFESRLSAIDDGVESLGADLQDLVARDVDDASLLPVALEIQRIGDEANDLQYAADDLQLDIESFERWLEEPSVRLEELAADIDAVAASIADLEDGTDTTDALDAGSESGRPEGDDADPGASWAEASIGHRVTELLLADVRAELADLRTMGDRLGEDGVAGADDVNDVATGVDLEARLEDLEARRASVGDRLDALARPAWRQRFDDRLATVDRVLASFEPPVDWDEFRAALDDRQ